MAWLATSLASRRSRNRIEEANPANPELGRFLDRLARATLKQGDADAARPLYERSLALCRRPDGGYYPQAVQTLDGCAALLRATGRKARTAEIEALAATARKPSP